MRKVVIFFLFFFIGGFTFSQENIGKVLIISNLNGKVFLDGTEIGNNQINIPFKVEATPGEHYIQIQGDFKGKTLDKGEIIVVESDKQKIVKWLFDEIVNEEAKLDAINVADLNIGIPGVSTVLAWTNSNPGHEYPYPTFYYAFESGDEVILDLTMSNLKGTNSIIISSYPSKVVKFSDKTFVELKDVRFKIEERTILKFVVSTNHVFDRDGYLKVKRIPKSKETISFNTNVTKQKFYKPEVVAERQDFFVNSGSNANFKGGKSRVSVPVKLPPNTIEWFYRFSAFRDTTDINNVKKSTNLFSELASLTVKMTGAGIIAGKATDIAIEQLSQPPGNNYCDIYLLTYENLSKFENKLQYSYLTQGTRENFKSGNVKIVSYNSGNYFLGIRNPDNLYGINVLIEIVAITMTQDYVMEQKE